MIPSAIAVGLYGILSSAGGVLGYRNSGSRVSLIAGLVSGSLLEICALMIVVLPAAGSGIYWVALALVLALVVLFAVRLGKTRKFMPAGLMLALGLLCVGVMALDRAGVF